MIRDGNILPFQIIGENHLVSRISKLNRLYNRTGRTGIQVSMHASRLCWWVNFADDVERLIVYSFTFCSRIFNLYGYVTITGEGLQNLDLCSALRAFEQGEIFIVPSPLWHGASVFTVSSESPPHLIASYDLQGDPEDIFQPGSSRVADGGDNVCLFITGLVEYVRLYRNVYLNSNL
jgi:hypothetical protein